MSLQETQGKTSKAGNTPGPLLATTGAAGDLPFSPSGSGALRRNWRFGLRLIFGLFWAADAFFKWVLYSQGFSYVQLISGQASGQPSPVASWITYWAGVAGGIPSFGLLMAVVETVIAAFILLGFLTKLTSIFGILFNLLVWTTAEGFGGIFLPGATDVGASPLYIAMFAGLIIVRAGMQNGLDEWLLMKHPGLRVLL